MTIEERKDIPGTYRVIYNVDARNPYDISCDCAAGCYGQVCHHVAAVLRLLNGEDE